MRIVITRLGNCLSLDGINVFIYELSEALIQLGHEVYLISSIASTFPLGGNANANTASVNKTVRERFSVIEVPNIISLHSSFHGKRTFFHYLEGNFFFISKGSWIINDLHPDMMILNGTTSFCPFFKVAVCHDLQFRAKFHKYYNLIMYHTIDKIVAPSSELGQEIKRQLHLSAKTNSINSNMYKH